MAQFDKEGLIIDERFNDGGQIPDRFIELLDRKPLAFWAVRDGAMESVGVLEPEKGAYMDMPTPDTEVAITVEPRGGSAQPTTDPIMRVNPSEI
jgi:hypothetical protein